jgi:hypothetical protein
MTPDRDTLLRQFERVLEPCSLSMGSPMSICDMGLVEDVRFANGVVDVVLAGARAPLDHRTLDARPRGFKRGLFNTAEGRLTSFHDEVMKRVGPR